MNDIRTENFAVMLEYLDPFPELTKKLDKRGTKCKSQKAHMILWWRSQITTGAKGFKRIAGNSSSRKAYNRLLNSGALIWLADAFGEDAEALESAVKKADAIKDYREKCAVIRETIPFDRLYELAHEPKRWRFDPAVVPLIGWYRGFPYINKQEEFAKVIEKELG